MTEGFTGAYIRLLAKTTVLRAVDDGKCGPDGVTCTFTADNLNSAAEQVMRNYQIGKRAKKHHTIEADVHVSSKDSLDVIPLRRASGKR
jgi:hypothetical protein